MEQRLSTITLGVEDLDRARGFFERLGWRPSSAFAESGQIVFFQVGGSVLALFPRAALAEDAKLAADGSGFGGVTLAYNVRQREDVDATLAEAEAAGATVLKPAEDTFWGGRSGYFADTEGHPWEVCWNPHFPLGDDGSVKLPD